MPRSAFRRLTTSAWEVDLRDLRRCGWSIVNGDVRAKLSGDKVLIWYGGGMTSAPLIATRPNFGGQRLWFCCLQCSRPARVVYSPSFICRRCAGLLHPSTRKTAGDRAIERAVRLRRRLGGDGSLLERFPPRPAGMHRKSWLRLYERCQRDESRGIMGMAERLGGLAGSVAF